jgi:hypothetical protein
MKAYGVVVVEIHEFSTSGMVWWITALYPGGYTSGRETPHTLNSIMSEPPNPVPTFSRRGKSLALAEI